MLLIGFEDRAKYPRQIANVLRNQKIMLHKTFDAATAGMVGIAHPATDFCLQVESQPLLGTPGEVMQVAANGPQETLGAIEVLRFFRRQHPQLDQFPDIVGAIDVLGYPEQGVEVSQPTLALLDIGLELITTIADPLVPLVPFSKLCCHELRGTALHDLRIKASLEFVKKRLVAPQITRLKQRGADGQIGLRLTETFLNGSC